MNPIKHERFIRFCILSGIYLWGVLGVLLTIGTGEVSSALYGIGYIAIAYFIQRQWR